MLKIYLTIAVLFFAGALAHSGEKTNIYNLASSKEKADTVKAGAARRLIDATYAAEKSQGEARERVMIEINALKADVCKTEAESNELEAIKKDIKKLQDDDPYKENAPKIALLKIKLKKRNKDIAERFFEQYIFLQLSSLEKKANNQTKL